MLLASCLIAALVASPLAAARGSSIDQGRFYSNADGDEIFSNEWNARQGGSNDIRAVTIGNGGSYDVALSAANCQLLVAVDNHVAIIAASSALAVIDDEDEVVITEGNSIPAIPLNLDSETSDADCNTPVGPIMIDVVTAAGWGAPAPAGALGEAAGALGKGGYYDNRIEQGRFEMMADLDDAFHNEFHLDQSVSNGAAAAANCQAVIAVHNSLLVAGLAEASATLKDGDTVAITEAPSTSSVGFELETPRFNVTIEVDNDHNASDSCSQPIESITIMVRPDTAMLPARS